ncbi:signal peptidase I [Spirochaeta isovalerica]|uniref:Signal peptidase I n=1 Tax=Spirochaeta isovalerica TaxID=150 RepID=A0A841R1H0_9SPIO|nr:signal peptidase I [Spirochaeta isovalerica]MBB6478834.1 signal peptidase I [Spirochaeta isovalerica]
MAVRFKRSYHDRKETVARRRKTILKVLILLLFFQIVFSLFAATIKMTSISMEPEVSRGSVMIYSPFVYGFKINMLGLQLPQVRTPERGDLIVLTPPYMERRKGAFAVLNGVVKFFTFGKVNLNSISSESWNQGYLIKRIVGIPGDTIRMSDYKVSIKPEGSIYFLSEFEVIDKDYDIQINNLPEFWTDDMPFSGNIDALTLEDDQYFVLGDNRMMSSDSTDWGVLSRERIEGLILMKYWPLNQFTLYK